MLLNGCSFLHIFELDHHFVQLKIPFLASFCFILEK
jgi:hypothetical protein